MWFCGFQNHGKIFKKIDPLLSSGGGIYVILNNVFIVMNEGDPEDSVINKYTFNIIATKVFVD